REWTAKIHQTKTFHTAGSFVFAARIFRALSALSSVVKLELLSGEMAKAFAAKGRTPFHIRLGAWHTRQLSIAALGLVRDYLWRRFINFKLRAHFLDLRGLLFKLSRQDFHPFLLLGHSSFQAFDFPVLLEKLVEQHRVDLLVADRHGFTILPHNEAGIQVCDLLGDQTILLRVFPIAVESEGHWLEPVQRFTGLVHRLNVVLVLSGRVEDAHHVKLIDKYCGLTPGVADDLAEDAADEAGVIKVSK